MTTMHPYRIGGVLIALFVAELTRSELALAEVVSEGDQVVTVVNTEVMVQSTSIAGLPGFWLRERTEMLSRGGSLAA